jgi:tRNA threonylcarbamoyladenosine biosynthesis protein TsaB
MTEPLELSIDTCSDMASIALSREGVLQSEQTWNIGRDHSQQLLPAIDAILGRLSASKDGLTAIFVAKGPGGYAGVRAGMSTAKALAFGLEVPLVGIVRLELDAYPWRSVGGVVAAAHRAGKKDFACAAYQCEPWEEASPPALVARDDLAGALLKGAFVTGEVDDELAKELTAKGHRVAQGVATVRRAATLAELGWERVQAGATDDPKSLVPLYLREPAIGPQG